MCGEILLVPLLINRFILLTVEVSSVACFSVNTQKLSGSG